MYFSISSSILVSVSLNYIHINIHILIAIVYKYKNAQRKQKVYQTIEGISRCRVGEYKSYLDKEVERFELVVLKLGGEIDEVKEILGGLVTEFGRRLRRAVKLCCKITF